MRNHNRAVLLRLTETDFLKLKTRAADTSLTVQGFLRDLLRYANLPDYVVIDGKTKKRKSLTA